MRGMAEIARRSWHDQPNVRKALHTFKLVALEIVGVEIEGHTSRKSPETFCERN